MTMPQVVHQLPGRLRLRFAAPLPPQHWPRLQTLIEEGFPDLPCRLWGQGQGVVIGDGRRPLPVDLRQRLPCLLLSAQQDAATTSGDGRQLNPMLMSLAILGWALPVMPGTPFFLLALLLARRRR
jgi:hypothetical protein